MRQRTQKDRVPLRLHFRGRSGLGPAIHGQPDARALEQWLSSVGQLRASAALDRSILDGIHQDLTRGPRAQPVLLLVVTLSCVVFGARVKFRPGETAPGPRLANSTGGERPVLASAVPAPEAPVPLSPRYVEPKGLVFGPATAKLPLRGTAHPLGSYPAKAKSALASRESAPSRPQKESSATYAVPPRLLAAVTPRPALPPSQPSAAGGDGEVRPISTGTSAGLPPVPIANSLSWSGAGLATAPLTLHERLNGMVSPTGLLASLPQARDSSHRPIYKRAWFVGMLGVAATGLAAGVTAAVVSSQQTAHGTSSQPIRISLGPT